MRADYYVALRHNLTPRMAQYLAYIEHYYTVHRQPLTVGQFRAAFGIKSAYRPLRRLEQAGLVAREWGTGKPKG